MKLKKILLIFAVIISVSALSQTREKGDLEIIGTVGFSNSGTSLITNARSSVRLSILGDYYLNNTWSIRTGLTSYRMGDEGLLFFQRDLRTSYLHIPINANWHFTSNRNWNLNFGLSAGFLTSAEDGGVDISDNLESYQIGISYGVGHKIQISEKFSLLFDCQAFIGITDIVSSETAQESNIAVSLNIGGIFKL